jgi:hypothetical protein
MTQPATYHRGSQNYGTGYEMMARIDELEATIKALVEALERIDDLTGHNMAMSARDEQCVNREARAALAAAKETPHE